MDSKTLIKALKIAVRQVIKEELTEILRDGLRDTITEMKQPAKKPTTYKQPVVAPTKKRPMFEDNKWASVLNETDALVEQQPSAMNSLSELMNEGMDDIHMTSDDAKGFGMMRQNMQSAIGLAPTAPAVMEDPETGKVYEVAPEVASALTRDYSALMKAIDKKKNR
jgi:hypothetical protein